MGEEKKEEANHEILSNPARVIKPQLKVVALEDSSKYQPLKDISIGGIVLVKTYLEKRTKSWSPSRSRRRRPPRPTTRLMSPNLQNPSNTSKNKSFSFYLFFEYLF